MEVKALSDKAILVGSRPEAREDTMVKMLLTVMVFSAPLAAVAADGQGDAGYVAPELRKPAPGQLLDEDYLTSTGETSHGPAFRSRRVRRRSTGTYASRMTASTTASARVVEGVAFLAALSRAHLSKWNR